MLCVKYDLMVMADFLCAKTFRYEKQLWVKWLKTFVDWAEDSMALQQISIQHRIDPKSGLWKITPVKTTVAHRTAQSSGGRVPSLSVWPNPGLVRSPIGRYKVNVALGNGVLPWDSNIRRKCWPRLMRSYSVIRHPCVKYSRLLGEIATKIFICCLGTLLNSVYVALINQIIRLTLHLHYVTIVVLINSHFAFAKIR